MHSRLLLKASEDNRGYRVRSTGQGTCERAPTEKTPVKARGLSPFSSTSAPAL